MKTETDKTKKDEAKSETKNRKYDLNLETATLSIPVFGLVFDLHKVAKNYATMSEIEKHLIGHGIKQKVVDALAKTSGVEAGSYTDDDRKNIASEQFDSLVKGVWATRNPSANTAIKALMEKHGVKSVEELGEILAKHA